MSQEQNANAEALMLANAEKMIKSMQTPQAIRDLQTFDGNPVKLHSFLRSVDNLLPFINALEGTPFHDVWLQAVRNKIVGDADTILEVYGTKLEWSEIKDNLIAYYNDKRDAVTLTRELFTLQQSASIEDFYGRVQHVLSLLINHANINVDELEEGVRKDRIKTYTDNALQVFLAGLKEPIGGNVRARQPKTLKEAFDACIEEQNFLRKAGLSKELPPKINFPKPAFPIPRLPFFPSYTPLPPPRHQNPFSQNSFTKQNSSVPSFLPRNRGNVPPRPTPMEVDRSIRSRNVNYMNRPPLPRFPPRPFNQHPPQPFYQQPPPRNFPSFPPRQAQEPRFIVEELTNTEQDFDPYYYQYPEDYHYFQDYQEYSGEPSHTYEDPKVDTPQDEPTTDELNFSKEAGNQPET